MGRLNQVIAVVSGKKSQAEKVLTDIYHRLKAELFNGISRVYSPKDEDGERLPSESKIVQNRVQQLISEGMAAVSEMYDVVATQDYANCKATADVVVDGKIVLPKVPVTHLLFLSKQVTDLATFISKLPVLDPSDDWKFDTTADCYATAPTETVRAKKVPKAFVKYEATKEHPAQVDVFTEDVLAGYWKTVKFSGAISAKDRNAMAERVRKLQEAVTKAREEANGIEVETVRVGKPIMDFVFGASAVSG